MNFFSKLIMKNILKNIYEPETLFKDDLTLFSSTLL